MVMVVSVLLMVPRWASRPARCDGALTLAKMGPVINDEVGPGLKL